MIKILKTDFEHADDRGRLVQLIHEGWEQVNVLISNKDVVRGGHYHKEVSEAFYVVNGSVVLIAKKDGIIKEYRFSSGDFFEVVPNTIHSMSFPEDCIMVQMYSKCVEHQNGTKDIYTEEVSSNG